MAETTEMATSSGFDAVASYARLSERVEGQGRDIVDLRSNMNTGFRNLEGSLKALSDQLSGSSRTQWPVIWSAIGVCFTVIAAIGTLAYWPVLSNQQRIEAAFVRMAENVVTQKELEVRAARGAEDRARTDQTLRSLTDSLVPRKELDRVFEGYDQRLADHQRQIDETKATLGNTYSLRDYIARITDRLDILEQRTISRGGPPT